MNWLKTLVLDIQMDKTYQEVHHLSNGWLLKKSLVSSTYQLRQLHLSIQIAEHHRVGAAITDPLRTEIRLAGEAIQQLGATMRHMQIKNDPYSLLYDWQVYQQRRLERFIETTMQWEQLLGSLCLGGYRWTQELDQLESRLNIFEQAVRELEDWGANF